MKIWIGYEGDNSLLHAIAGGVSSSVAVDCTEWLDSITGNLSTQLQDGGHVPVLKVVSPLAMKREFLGLAIIIQKEGDNVLKSGKDIKTLLVKLDGTNTERDNAVEKILAFLKTNKVKSPL